MESFTIGEDMHNQNVNHPTIYTYFVSVAKPGQRNISCYKHENQTIPVGEWTSSNVPGPTLPGYKTGRSKIDENRNIGNCPKINLGETHTRLPWGLGKLIYFYCK